MPATTCRKSTAADYHRATSKSAKRRRSRRPPPAEHRSRAVDHRSRAPRQRHPAAASTIDRRLQAHRPAQRAACRRSLRHLSASASAPPHPRSAEQPDRRPRRRHWRSSRVPAKERSPAVLPASTFSHAPTRADADPPAPPLGPPRRNGCAASPRRVSRAAALPPLAQAAARQRGGWRGAAAAARFRRPSRPRETTRGRVHWMSNM